MRVVLLPVTCDHPAQCATGKLLNEGKAGCRRFTLLGFIQKRLTIIACTMEITVIM